jgi:hypothetical protein
MGTKSATKNRVAVGALFAMLLGSPSRARAYPEFQRHIQLGAGRVVSCGMCHAHPDGPDGVKHGQIGSLGQGELQALSRSRSMLEPGPVVDSPILNPFGDYLVGHLGRKKLMAFKSQPAALIAAIDQHHDLDGDGIADARELRDGTDPTDPRHGDPGLLFLHNVRHYWFHLAMLAAATLLGLFGLSRLFRWFAYEARLAADSKGSTHHRLSP